MQFSSLPTTDCHHAAASAKCEADLVPLHHLLLVCPQPQDLSLGAADAPQRAEDLGSSSKAEVIRLRADKKEVVQCHKVSLTLWHCSCMMSSEL